MSNGILISRRVSGRDEKKKGEIRVECIRADRWSFFGRLRTRWTRTGQSCTALVALAFSPAAIAAEGAVYGGPQGGTDIQNAYTPPISGLYGEVLGIGINSGELDGDSDGKVPIHVNVDAAIAGVGLFYVYPFQVLGGALDTAALQAGGYDQAAIANRTGYKSGLDGTFVEFLGWSHYFGPLFGEGASPKHPFPTRLPYGLVLTLAYSMIFPDGTYKPSYVISPGANNYFFIPNIALTYLTPPNAFGDGFEFDSHLFVDFASLNPETHYHTGTVIDDDFAVADRIGRFEFGIAGFYAQQLTRDNIRGAVVFPNGDRLLTVGLGPVVSYTFPKLGSELKIKFLRNLYQQDSLSLSELVVSYAMKF